MVARIWDRMVQSFQDMFKRKAFLHWYLGEGMEEADFTQAENSVLEMITEYQLQEVDGYYVGTTKSIANYLILVYNMMFFIEISYRL